MVLRLLSQADARWLMREIGEPIKVEDAVEAGGLVIESPRVVYWRRDLIDIQWTPGTWEFFELLVRNAKIGQPIDADSFGELSYRTIVAN